MNKFLKTAFYSVLACGTMMFLACGDDKSAPYTPEDKDPSEQIDSTEIYNAFTDKRDGNVYRVVLIGSQAWMAEDLRYWDKEAYPILEDHGWCATSVSRCKKNGFLYDFAAVVGNSKCNMTKCDYDYPLQGICPEGWHVPNKYEWEELLGTADEMEISLDDFSPFATYATGEFNSFADSTKKDDCARYWTSTQESDVTAHEFYRCKTSSFDSQVYSKNFGYAVRCVADSVPKFDTFVKFVVPEKTSSSSSWDDESSSSGKEIATHPRVLAMTKRLLVMTLFLKVIITSHVFFYIRNIHIVSPPLRAEFTPDRACPELVSGSRHHLFIP